MNKEGNMTEEHSVISSLIVETMPENMAKVEVALAALDGVEVHGSENGKIVITIEKGTTTESHNLANSITQMDGVITVNLIYANFEDDPETQGMYDTLQERVRETQEKLYGQKPEGE